MAGVGLWERSCSDEEGSGGGHAPYSKGASVEADKRKAGWPVAIDGVAGGGRLPHRGGRWLKREP